MKKIIVLLTIIFAICSLVQADDTTEVYIGNPEATASHAQRVLNFNMQNALSQTLYFEDEMIIDGELKTGLITEIRWLHRYNSAVALDVYPVSIYMAHTTLTAFPSTTSWLPYDQFTKVYEGTLDIQITGPVGTPFQEVPVILNTPFEYTGGNFVIMAYKLKPDGSPQAANQWQVSVTRPGSRNLWQSSNTIWPHISVSYPTAGTLAPNGDFANTIVVFFDGTVGHLGGTVTSEGSPIADVKVSVDDTGRFAFSDAAGIYSLPNLPVGSYNITASKYLYLDTLIEDIEILENQTTTQNIEISGTQYDLTALSISGFLYPVVGEAITHTITIKNEAIQTQNGGYIIELRQVGLEMPLATAVGVSIESEQIIDFEMTWTPTIAGEAEIYGVIVFEEDENPENNTTELLTIDTQQAGAVISYIGDAAATTFVRENPMDHFYRHSLSQTIYLESEIESPGLLSQLHYRFRGFGDIVGGSPIQVYLAHTELEHFNAGTANAALWVPFDQFTLVFNGTIPTHGSGERDIQIVFDTLYPYVGGNLVVMVHKAEAQNYGLNNLYHSTTTTGLNRTISNYSSTTPYNLEVTYPTPTRRARIPNIRLITLTQGHGTMSGVVSHEGELVDDVRIVINEIGISTTTNAAGVYTFPYLVPGTYSITASKHAYQTQTINNIVVTAGETTTQNIVMVSIPWDLAAVSIVGPTIPIAQSGVNYTVRVRNEGFNTVNPDQYTVVIKRVGNNNVLGTTTGATIEPGEEISFQVPWTPPIAENLQIYGEVVFAQDMEETNNTTSNYSVFVQPVGMNAIYIGDALSTNSTSMHPINYLWRNSLTQTIYLDSELTTQGAVTGIMLRYVGTDMIPNHPVSIYLAPTDIDNFVEQDTWIPFEQFDLVYHGTPTIPGGPADFFLPFDTPFIHAGGNIAVMIYKHHEQQIYTRQWQVTPTSVGTGGRRVIYAYHDTTIIDPENGIHADFPTGWIALQYANSTFLITQEGLGHISGTVTNQGVPEEGVEISLNGTSRKVFSDEEGNYSIPYVFSGTVSLTARKHGFYDHTINNISVVAGETTQVNIPMPAIPVFTVSGRIVSSDTGLGVPSADIKLTGYENYTATTNNQGNFTISGVYELNTYALEVYKSGYVKYFDEEIVVVSANLVIPDILLYERAYPINNLQAVSSPTEVTLTWEAPTGGLETWMHHTYSEESIGGWSSMATPYSVTLAIRFSHSMLDEMGVAGAELSQVSYFLHTLEVPGVHTVLIYSGGNVIGEGSGAIVNPGNLIYEQEVDVTQVAAGQWNYIDLDEIVDIPVGIEFWIAVNVSYSQGFVLGRDQGPAVLPGFSDIIDYGNGWGLFGWAVSGNNMLQGLAKNAHGPIIMGVRSSEFGVRNTSSLSPIPYPLSPQSRALSEYMIYRASIETLDDESTWTFVDSTTALTYTDTEWTQLAHGAFRYIVKSVYTEENVSRPVFSNMVHRGMEGTVDIYIDTNDAVSLESVTVLLSNNSGNQLHVYQQTVNSNFVHFPAVWRGTYTVIVTSQGYKPFVTNNVVIAPESFNMDVMMIRPLVPQFVMAQQVPQGVIVDWTEPDPGLDIWYSHTNAAVAVSGIGPNTPPATFTIAHRFTPEQLQAFGVAGATLTKVAYAPWQIATTHEIQIFVGGSASPYQEGEMVLKQDIDNADLSIAQFSEFELHTPIFIPFDQELWIGINMFVEGGFPAGTDAGPHLIGYGNLINWNGAWTTLNAISNVSANWTIRGMAEGASGPIAFGSVDIPYNQHKEDYLKTLSGLGFTNGFMFEAEGGQSSRLSTPNSELRTPNSQPYLYHPITRVAEGYRVYRANEGSMDDPDLWDVLEENHDTYIYLDDTWWEAETGAYQYIVKTILADDNLSRPAFSNIIHREPFDFAPPEDLTYHIENLFDVVLNWKAPNNVLRGYKVLRGTTLLTDLTTNTTIKDEGLDPGDYTYYVIAVYFAGESEPVSIDVEVTGSDTDNPIPLETVLRGNFPNPFNPSTTISFDIREEGAVRLDIFNIRGQRVRTLVNEEKTSGKYTIEWIGTDDNGRSVGSGIYFYRMTAVEYSETKRMVLMK